MSKKPVAALSANLVAIKGMAVPTPDMPSRAAPAVTAPASAPPPSAPPQSAPVPRTRTDSAEGEGREASLTPLNFRISASFRREFKTYAAGHDLKLNELLRRSFEAYRRAQGD
jgi:hypothetical protein